MANDMTDAIKAKMEADPAFATALGAARTREAAVAVLQKAGFHAAADEIKARELTAGELERISGGRLWP